MILTVPVGKGISFALHDEFRGNADTVFAAQYSDSLSAPAWTDLGASTNTLGSTTLNTLTDPTPNPAGRFYRLEREPAP
jgi:hypothetical protein